MKQLRVAPIVEGHGEYESIRPLLTRIWYELLGGERLDVLRPIRHKRHQLVQVDNLHRAADLAVSKLMHAPGPRMPTLVLILIDADRDLPCELAPKLLTWAKQTRPDIDFICIVANVEYETWFVAAAESLTEYFDLSTDRAPPDAPEQQRLGERVD